MNRKQLDKAVTRANRLDRAICVHIRIKPKAVRRLIVDLYRAADEIDALDGILDAVQDNPAQPIARNIFGEPLTDIDPFTVDTVFFDEKPDRGDDTESDMDRELWG